MKKRLLAGVLALFMVLQTFTPSFAKSYSAKTSDNKLLSRGLNSSDDNLITIGELKGINFSKDNPSASLSVEKDYFNGINGEERFTLFSTKSPYIKGNQPADPDKPKYWANVKGKLSTVGIDGGRFDWNKVLGQGAKVNLLFTQTNGSVITGVSYNLSVDKDGEYTWKGSDGKPTLLPLFDDKGNAYSYNIQIKKDFSENVDLIIETENGTPSAPFRNEDGKFVATISYLNMTIKQVASTKFVSDWHTDVEEANRPQIEGHFDMDGNDLYTNFNFPKNNTSETVFRKWHDKNFAEDENKEFYYMTTDELLTTPQTVEVKTDTTGLTFDTTKKTVKSGDHTYKYEFKYDVINGGKLTMTEVLPVTFDANGGKFASITEPNAEQKIVKEVDYGNDLTDKVEEPKKDLETFKGWSETKDGKPLSKEQFETAIKNITEAKKFYAVWNNNDITAEVLEVKESYNDGTKYVNDFIPTLEQLKGQVKIKDASGTPKALTTETFEILKDDGQTAFTQDEINNGTLKNYLYEKLQEKDDGNKPTRVETVKAKVTFANNTSQTVDIPIKVIKNIYEAKTLTEKPYYVPSDYVKVILDPTTKATDTQKTYYYVNPAAKVVIPGDDPTGTDNWTFEKWIIKGTTTKYDLTSKPRHQFTENETTIEAQYVSNIIPAKADGSRPDNVPTDFVLVEFKAGSNGTLDGITKYWVNPNAGKTLSDITHPNIKPNNGWKANGWDKVDTTTITGPTEVTAKYLEKVSTQEPSDDIKDKYVKVTFKQGDHGTIANGEQTQYWVLKQEKVDLTAPEVTAKTGYAQKSGDAAWSPEVAEYYYKDTVHTAQYDFNGTDVIEQRGNDKPTNVPDGYVLVEFSAGKDGKFKANQTTKYWVNPKKEVTLTAPTVIPNTGYKQQNRLNAWDEYLTQTFTQNKTITAQYEALGDILTEEKTGYAKVEFKAGNKGTLDGTTEYWVNPLKGKKLGDITHPNVKPNDGWSYNGWDKADNTAITASPNPLTVTAQYLEKVLTLQPTVDSDKYVTVEFTKGEHGTIEGTQVTKYWVLKGAEVSLTAPRVTPATGYAQKSGDEAWSPKQATKYSANTVHVAQYYYNGDDVIAPNPNGLKPDTVPTNFVLVEFKQGDHGTIDANQTVKYWVNPNKEVTLTAPSVTAKQGYEQKPGFNAWDKYLTATFKDTTKITAQYNKLADILTEKKPGYVKVEFNSGDHGTLDGTTTYWVNPAANKKLSDIRHPNVTAEDKYKHVGWDLDENTVITEAKVVTAKYLKDVLTSDPNDTTNYVKVTFNEGAHGSIAGQAEYWVLKNTEVSITPPTVTADTSKGYKQKDGKDAWSPEIATAYSKNTTHVAQYEYQGNDVIEQQGNGKPTNVPNDFVKVTFKPTDKAATNVDKIFWVKPNVEVTINIAKPEGQQVAAAGSQKAYKWQFEKWVSKETATRTWDTNIDTGITSIFKTETVIEAKYTKSITDQGTVVADEITIHESFKEGNNWVNDFIKKEATEAILKAAVKVTNANGQPEALPQNATVTFLNDAGAAITGDDLKALLYEKLQEKPNNTEPIRTEKLKAKVTFQNGEEQTVDIPIKVYKNIYEATTKEGKPTYVPAGYVKVTVDPTTKATEPQKYFYYVNPAAEVVIPENNPVGTGDNKFVKWTMKEDTATGDGTEYKLKDKPRTQFKKASTITAQYVSDVIPQDGPNKPDTVPENFVEVKFVPTKKATDETKAEKIFWVNPDKKVTIPVKDPVGKQYFRFKEWKIGVDDKGDKYTPSTPKKFEEATTITATYEEAKNIIPYNPEEPITRPDGYVRVAFAADPGLKLTEQKAYYVKKNAGIKLGNADLIKPKYEAQSGYKFEKWDKDDTTVILDADIIVTAKATKLETVIPATAAPNEKPDGYKEVNFVIKTGDESKGSLEGTTKYYVNPNEYVTITPPTPKAETGFVFGSWDKDTKVPNQYKNDETITASFNTLGDHIPEDKGDGTKNTKPEGYYTVTFEIEKVNNKVPAKFVKGEKLVYFVKPNAKVTINPPQYILETGYKFEKWEPDTTQETTYAKDTVVKGIFTKLEDIIPSTKDDGTPNGKPDGYVRVTFITESEGKLKEGQKLIDQKVYYVNPKAGKQIGELKPDVKPDTGYKQDGWAILGATNYSDNLEIKDDLIIKAKYTALDDVVPKTKPQGGENAKPAGYFTVTFKTTDKGGNVEKVVYINPNKAVKLEGQAPTVSPITGYDFAGWDKPIKERIQYKDGAVITAQFNVKGDVIPQKNTDGTDKPAGYLTVTFDKGTNGEKLEGKTVYYVKPSTKVTVPAPDVIPNVGYEFEKWDQELTQTFTKDTKITATYKDLPDFILQKDPNIYTDRPKGYNQVSFVGKKGTLNGKTVIRYYVNPNKEVDFTGIVNGFTKKPYFGYTKEGGTWSGNGFKKKFTDQVKVYTFTFQQLENVIEKIDDNTNKPEGYVTVKLVPTNKATDATKAEKVYFVNPKENVTITNKPEGKEETINDINYTYTFTGWTVTRGTIASWNSETISGKFIQETEITAQYSTKVVAGKILPAPVAKKDVVTPIKEEPKPEDLIENKTELPTGTTFIYTNDGKPNVNNPGKTTAKVEVKYPGGKTVVVEVPITVVDHVVPQIGGENGQKPLVPEDYVKVTVDTTDKATENTKFTKVFWVKQGVEVTIPGILDPTGKPETKNGVTKTNNFKKWKLEDSNPEKFYKNEIKDTFTAKESKIVATYEFDKNAEPVGKNNRWIPKGSNPSPKDFIKNPYDDNDPNNLNNLPPGTQFKFVDGFTPSTSEQGKDKITKVEITYPNGEKKIVEVKYNVTDDVVEQTDPSTKPVVPDNFVKVIVKTTDMATDATKFEKTFWVNPTKVVTIPVANPTGKAVNKPDGTVDYTWEFTGWDKELTQKFDKETTITAKYRKDYGKLPEIKPIPEARGGFIYTDLGQPVTNEQYKSQIQLPAGYSFNTGTTFGIVPGTEPNINKTGLYSVKAWVTYPDGSGQEVTILVYVGEARVVPQPLPQPGGSGYHAIYIEKKVEVPAKIKPLHKAVRYMQGFNGYFRPNDGLTRAEAAQILANALREDGYNYNPNYQISYKDIGREWYTEAVRITTEANVFAGYDDGFFRPEKKITRAEWVATLRRFQNIAKADGNHMNLSGNHWAKGEIEGAFNEGWLKIYTDGLAKFNADEFIPRQEVAAVSNRAFNRVFDKTYIIRNDKAFINQYKDVKPSMWAYEDILCASNTFVHDEQLYRAHDVNNDKITFNVNLGGLEIIQDKFQRILR